MKTENVFVIHRFKIAILPQPILDRGEHMISKRIPAVILIFLAVSICFVSAYVYSQGNNIVTLTIMNRPYYYVENNTSNVDSSVYKGTYSNFTAQQHGPDSIYDTLTEENMLVAGDIAKVGADTSGSGINLTLSLIEVNT